jgi:hypothetical protein
VSEEAIAKGNERVAGYEHQLVLVDKECQAYKAILKEAEDRERTLRALQPSEPEASKLYKLKTLDEIKNMIVTHKYAHRTSR